MEIMMLEMHDVVTGSNLSENPNEGGGYEGLPGYPTTTSF